MTKQSWADKHRPEEFSDIHGNNKNLKYIKKWSKKFSKGDKPLLLHGDQGTGKTSTAEVVAKENGWPIEEINASSARTKDDILQIASQIRSRPLNAEFKVVLIDEADALKSSLTPLKEVLDNPPNPVILTCNEEWKVPDSISNRCESKEFKVGKSTKKAFINDICDKEGIELSNQDIGKLATRDDLRSIINDLQRFAKSSADVGWDDRDTDIGEFDAVDNILKGKKFTGEVSPPDLVQWLSENVSSELEGVEAMRSYQVLSEADKWLELTNKTQNYSWWRYAGSIAEEVAEQRQITEPYHGWVQKSYPKIRRNKRPSPTKDNAQATLYRDLKDYEKPSYSASFNYDEFRNIVLPQLKSLPEEKKMQLILTESISGKGMKALDVTKSGYEDWVSSERDEEVEVEEDDVDEEEDESEEEAGGSLFSY